MFKELYAYFKFQLSVKFYINIFPFKCVYWISIVSLKDLLC